MSSRRYVILLGSIAVGIIFALLLFNYISGPLPQAGPICR